MTALTAFWIMIYIETSSAVRTAQPTPETTDPPVPPPTPATFSSDVLSRYTKSDPYILMEFDEHKISHETARSYCQNAFNTDLASIYRDTMEGQQWQIDEMKRICQTASEPVSCRIGLEWMDGPQVFQWPNGNELLPGRDETAFGIAHGQGGDIPNPAADIFDAFCIYLNVDDNYHWYNGLCPEPEPEHKVFGALCDNPIYIPATASPTQETVSPTTASPTQETIPPTTQPTKYPTTTCEDSSYYPKMYPGDRLDINQRFYSVDCGLYVTVNQNGRFKLKTGSTTLWTLDSNNDPPEGAEGDSFFRIKNNGAVVLVNKGETVFDFFNQNGKESQYELEILIIGNEVILERREFKPDNTINIEIFRMYESSNIGGVGVGGDLFMVIMILLIINIGCCVYKIKHGYGSKYKSYQNVIYQSSSDDMQNSNEYQI